MLEVLRRGPPANKKLFTGGLSANKKLFTKGPLANKKLFAGGPLENTKLYAGALSILCSPEWSYAVLSCFSLYCMVLYSHAQSSKVLYRIILLYYFVLFGFFMVVQNVVWSYLVVYGP